MLLVNVMTLDEAQLLVIETLLNMMETLVVEAFIFLDVTGILVIEALLYCTMNRIQSAQ